jgi:DNA-binding HxlR family transcriptional regulator
VRPAGPFSAKRTFVQVKSRASQKVLEERVSTLAASGLCDRIIFACHTPVGTLSEHGRADLEIWTGDRIAELTIKHGLIDWLIERAQ